jgi:O-antigen/teichoic acid export membrane protein
MLLSMIKPRDMFSAALVYTVTSVLAAGVPILMLPILTRVLTPADYGTMAMFSVLLAVLGAFTGLSVHGAVGIRFFQGDRYDFPRYVGTCLTILLASVSAVLVGVWLLLPWLEHLTKLPGAWLIAAVFVSGAQFVIQIRLVIWQSGNHPWRFGAFRIGQAMLDATASLIMVLVLGMAWEGRVAGITLAMALFALAALISLHRTGGFVFAFNRDYASNALKFGIPLIPHTIGGMLIAIADRFMISNVLDVASTGVYMVALQIGMVLALLAEAFNKACSPWLIQSLGQASASTDRLVVRFTYSYFGIIALAAIVLGILAPTILDVLVGEKYRTAAPIVLYITLGSAFGGMYLMVANHIFFAGRTGRLAVVTLVSGLFNLTASYSLLKHNGVVGAGQAYMLAQAILFLGAWWVAQKSHPMPWLRSLMPSPAVPHG